jgi:hypothetical protein
MDLKFKLHTIRKFHSSAKSLGNGGGDNLLGGGSSLGSSGLGSNGLLGNLLGGSSLGDNLLGDNNLLGGGDLSGCSDFG